jgi:predicted secreted protein
MGIIGGTAIFGLIWFLTLFAVLPFGVRTSEEAGEEGVEGAADSAPVQAQMGRKLLITTGIAFAIWLVVFIVIDNGLLTLDDIPFLPRFGEDVR